MENMKDVWDTKDSVKMCLLEVLEVEEGHGAEAQFEEILRVFQTDWRLQQIQDAHWIPSSNFKNPQLDTWGWNYRKLKIFFLNHINGWKQKDKWPSKNGSKVGNFTATRETRRLELTLQVAERK